MINEPQMRPCEKVLSQLSYIKTVRHTIGCAHVYIDA